MRPGADFAERTTPVRRAVRILLIEDDPISVEIVGTYLRRIAYAEVELYSAATLADALGVLAQVDVDLVVSDLHLPDSHGAATVKSVVESVECPVIAITADRDPLLREATLGCGAFEFLPKDDLTELTLMRLVRLATMQARTSRSLRESRVAEAALRQSEGRFRSLARFGQAALVELEPGALMQRAAGAIFDALGVEAVAYIDIDPAGDLVLRAVVSSETQAIGPATLICEPDDPLLEVMRLRNVAFADASQLPFAWTGYASRAAIIPVRAEDKMRGMFCVSYEPAARFGDEEVNFVHAISSVLTTALQRIDSEARLSYLAQFDPLTSLPNRALLADRFAQMIAQAKRRQSQLAVLFIDLDGFKAVNDTLGHAGGDVLLKEVAQRLQAAVRMGDTVARISGDEFAIVLAELSQPEDAALVAQKVIEQLGKAVEIDGTEVFVTASVGIAAFPADGEDAQTLIGAADAAMYRAKKSGRTSYQFYTAEIHRRSRARVQLGAELRRALERDEFALFYQPKFQLASGELSGTEALLRWRHPERGLVLPDEFIPILEETGLIVPVGEWAIGRACADLKAWQAAGLRPAPVSVNLSVRQLRQQNLDVSIRSVVAAAGVDPGLIELELTESHLMQDPEQATRIVRALSKSGFRIAIDDFGTGYSSLAYLTRFPLSALKIDRSFVSHMPRDKTDATIVRTIIEMAHSLGLTVVAEGVETEEQARLLQVLRCEQAQGYLFAKPMPADELARIYIGKPARAVATPRRKRTLGTA
jgi:diguanylate cyclase (GGDEF)-like protein